MTSVLSDTFLRGLGATPPSGDATPTTTVPPRDPEREAALRELDAKGWELSEERERLAAELAELEQRIANGEQQIAERKRQGGKAPPTWLTLLLDLRGKRNAAKGKLSVLDGQITVLNGAFEAGLGELEKVLEGVGA